MALTPEQRQQILNSPNFQGLINKPEPVETTEPLGFVERVRQARTQTALPVAPTLPTQRKEEPGFFDKVKEEGSRIFGRVKEDIAERFETVEEKAQLKEEGKIGLASQIFNFASQATGAVGNAMFEAVVSLTPDELKEDLKEVGADIAKSDTGQSGIEAAKKVGAWWDRMKTEYPEATTNIESVVNVSEVVPVEKALSATVKGGKKIIKAGIETAESVAGATKKVAGETVEGAVKLGEKTVKDIGTGIKKLPTAILKEDTVDAISQFAKEGAERIPRVAGRVKGAGEEAIERAKRIRTSEPAVANAIKAKVDDRIINSVSEADDATRRAYKQVIDIADESPKTIGAKKQPSVVSGDLAVKQYDIINTKKKSVGKNIGDEVAKLSKTVEVDMKDGIAKADNLLDAQGVKIIDGKLDFKGSNFTPAERTKINELYNLATEGGDNLSPLQVRGKDQLFSKLQREANMEGIGSILVDTGDGKKSLFSVFRDIFSDKLDTVSPEIKKLNKEYRDLILITDDIENSILKTPNFNATKSADPAEFAKVNMRRIFGEAQSSPVFEAVAGQMDALARKLGYNEATPKQIAEFAIEMRKLYPESIPKAGFTGGISGGIKASALGVAEKVLKAGSPDLIDQRKALKELLDFYLNKK